MIVAESTPNPPADEDPADATRAPSVAHEEGTPRWVKVFGIVALIVIVIVVIVHLAGGGFHPHAMQ